MEDESTYLKFKFALGFVTLLIGLWAANMAMFNWVEQTNQPYMLGAYARYMCAYGGFAAIIFGAMLINEFLIYKNALKRKNVKKQEIEGFYPHGKTKAETLTNQRKTDMGHTIMIVSIAILLFMLLITIAAGTVSYIATVVVMPRVPAFIYYRSNSGAYLLASCKERAWNGSSWSSERELPSSGSNIRYVRVANCPSQQRPNEKVVVTLSDDGYLDVYVWNGSSWLTANNIAYSGTANAYRCFDITYEKTSGRALLVYSRGTTTNEIGYKIWNGTAWSPEQLLDLPYTTGIVGWISLASKPTNNANEIAMIYLDANADVHGYVWTGSEWNLMGATAVWDANAATSTRECIAVTYEQKLGRAMFIWGSATRTNNYYRLWNGTTLSPITILNIPTQGGTTRWATLKSDPTSNGLLYMAIDGGYDLNTAYWNGNEWIIHTEHDNNVDANSQRCADFEWEPTGNKGLLVWGTTSSSLSFKTFTTPSTWSATSTITASGTHPWIQLKRNTDSTSNIKILGAMLNNNFNLGALKWNGTTLTNLGDSAFTSNTNTIAYECFEITFN
ncbi:MAG: hypothetical protein QW270_08310 [Candidatus Bathyarchaeia archaeon]